MKSLGELEVSFEGLGLRGREKLANDHGLLSVGGSVGAQGQPVRRKREGTPICDRIKSYA
jgi:hypothetical protein